MKEIDEKKRLAMESKKAFTPLFPLVVFRSTERQQERKSYVYHFVKSEYGELHFDDNNWTFAGDKMEVSKKSDKRYTLFVPTIGKAKYNLRYSDLSEMAQSYMLTLAYRFTARALLTNYQKSGLPFLYEMLIDCRRQAQDIFGVSMFQEIETEIKVSRRYYDKQFNAYFERERPVITQRAKYDKAKERTYSRYDELIGAAKTVSENETSQDVDNLIQAAMEAMLLLVRTGQIVNFSDFSLQSGVIYKYINKEISAQRTIQAEMQDNVRYFDEKGLEKIVSGSYFDKHTRIEMESIASALEKVLSETHKRKDFDTRAAASAYILSFYFTHDEIARQLKTYRRKVTRYIDDCRSAVCSARMKELIGALL